MKIPTSVAAGLIAASLAGGAVGAALFAPVVSGAQESDDATEQTVPADDADAAACELGHRPGLEVAAEAIGIDVDALHEALRDGQTIAEVAEANDVDPQDVIDAMVTAAEEHLAQAVEDGRITQDQADRRLATLEERITGVVNGDAPLPRPGRFGPRGRHWFGGGDTTPEADAEASDAFFAA